MRIAVAGAGVAGLAAATLLARRGHDVTIYDRFPEPQPVGSGLMIQPVVAPVTAELGIADGLAAAASRIARVCGHTACGRPVLDVAYANLDPAECGLAVQRSVLFDLLLKAALAAGAALTPATVVTGAAVSGDIARLETEAGRLGPFDMVLDCLGAYSPLCPRPSKPLRYGALFALLDWPDGAQLAPDRLEQRYRRADRMAGVLPVGRRPGEPLRLTFFYSLRGADYGTWRAAPIDAWKDEVRALWPETEAVLDQIDSHDDLVFAQYTHHTVRRPGRGRIAHLGDSHHATSPQLGQGANTALLDAWALVRAMDDHADPAAATRAYGRARRRHVSLYQTASWALTPLYQSDSRIAPVLRDRIGWPVSRIPPMPRLLARLVAGQLVRPVRGL